MTTGDRSAVYLNAFDGVRFSAIQVNAPFGTDPLREPVMLQSRDGAWWLTAADVLHRFHPSRRVIDLASSHPDASFTVRRGPMDDVLVYPLYPDSKGDLWFAAWWSKTGAHELYSWELGTHSVRSVSTAGAPSLKHKSVT